MTISLSADIDAALHTGLNDLTQSMHPSGNTATRDQRVDQLLASLKPPANAHARECLRAGLYLLAGDLHQAHEICQAVPTAHGSAWHAIVHRREGDFWNSKYWWRRATGLTFPSLPAAIRESLPALPTELTPCLTNNTYNPAAFVDLVEQHAKGPALREPLLIVQRLEFAALLAEGLNS